MDILIGPKCDLHTGVHSCLVECPPPHVTYEPRDASHIFSLDRSQIDPSPHRNFHYCEAVDFGHGDNLVHSSRWPVINRAAWIADTDDFGYPIIVGRHVVSPDCRQQYARAWSEEFRKCAMTRARNMLSLYLHPSCKAILFRSHDTLSMIDRWESFVEIQECVQLFRLKCRVLYPAVPAGDHEAVEAKWRDPKRLNIVFCGRDFDSKNGEYALRQFERISQRSDVQLTYIGHIPSEYQRAHNNLLGRIRFVPRCARAEVLAALKDAHILFHPSKFESIGIIFIEASSMGLAVVSAEGGRMPNMRELFLSDGALLVNRNVTPLEEEEASFADLLDSLLDDTAIARRMGLANYERSASGLLSVARRDAMLATTYREALDSRSVDMLREADLATGPNLQLHTMSSDAVQRDLEQYADELQLTSLRFDL
jgi:glycosyltransferase involved in cell wall biosynthesis